MARNERGLNEHEINNCINCWVYLGGNDFCRLDITNAYIHNSMTYFEEKMNVVRLGADAYPGIGLDARSRMSMLACLAHEMSHAERFRKEYKRPIELPGKYIDEAEASINASFYSGINPKDREDLIEDAKDQLIEWLKREDKHDN